MNYDDIWRGCSQSLLIETFIPLKPMPKQSFRMGNGRGYTPKKLVEYVKGMKQHWLQTWTTKPVSYCLFVSFCFCSKFREADKTFATKATFMINLNNADLDNYTKPCQDAMQGIVFQNDKQVCFLHACKVRTFKEGVGIQVFTVNQAF